MFCLPYKQAENQKHSRNKVSEVQIMINRNITKKTIAGIIAATLILSSTAAVTASAEAFAETEQTIGTAAEQTVNDTEETAGETAEETSEENIEEKTGENAEETSEEKTEETSDEKTEETSEAKTEETSEAKTEETSEAKTEETSEEKTEETSGKKTHELSDIEEARKDQKVMDKIAGKIKNTGIKIISTGVGILFDKIPGGKCLAVPVTELIGLGMDKDAAVGEVMAKIDEVRNAVDEHLDENTTRIINSMKNSFTEGTYGSDMKSLMDTYEIERVKTGDLTSNIHGLTEEEKLVKLAGVVGNAENWSTEGQIIKKFKAVTADLMGRNYVNKDDLFTVLYKSNTQNYMFSGEVHDAVKPYIVSTLTDYYEVSSYILASLNAQKKLLSADFDASKINDPNLRKQYESFRNAESTIDDMIIYVQKSILGQEFFKEFNIGGSDSGKTYDSIAAHFDEFNSRNSRTIFLNNGRDNIDLSPDMNVVDTFTLINGSKEDTAKFGGGSTESTNKKEFDRQIFEKGVNGEKSALSKEQLNRLCSYVRTLKKPDGSSYNLPEFLTKMGFEIDRAPGSYILTGDYFEYDYSFGFLNPSWKSGYEGVSTSTGEPTNVHWKSNERDVWSTSADVTNTNMYLFRTK